jgi:hypothetical protein
VIELTAQFVPVSEDYYRFDVADQEAKAGKPAGTQTAEYRFFDKLLRRARLLGKEAGETSALLGNDTHTQGMYAVTPSGRVLGMIHQWNRPDLYAAMLRRSLARWAKLPRAQRLLPQAPDRAKGRLGDVMRADLYPRDGLVLTQVTRALPYEPEEGPGYDRAIASHPIYTHLDHVWFRKQEARQFLPERIEEGAWRQVPRSLMMRLAQLHLGTNTDTITGWFADTTVKEARLTVVVVAVAGGRAECRLEGRTVVDGPQDWADHKNSGYRANLLGRAVYDLKSERFVEFDLVALGIRSHGPEGRKDAPNPMPLGELLTLAGQAPADRLPPGYLDRYGW